MRSLRATFVCFSIAVLAAALLALAPLAADAQFGVKRIPPQVGYFRFKAEYTVIATGEVVKFDLVRPCFSNMARDSRGASIGMPPLKPGGYYNGVDKFPKVTSDHHAIVVRIPRACDGQTTANGKVQKDLMPYATWFEDADDFSFGWQYAGEDAYRSSLAKIRFDGASIEAATKDDFDEWEKHAGDGFRPSKVVTDPRGLEFKFVQSDSMPLWCTGVGRLVLPPELRALAKAALPSGDPRFWELPAQPGRRTPEQTALYNELHTTRVEKHVFNGDHPLHAFRWDSGNSVATRLDGMFGFTWRRSPDFFPQVFRHPGDGLFTVPFADIKPELRGFLTCFTGAPDKPRTFFEFIEGDEFWYAPKGNTL